MQLRFRIPLTLFLVSILLPGTALISFAQEPPKEEKNETVQQTKEGAEATETDDLAEVLAGHSYHGEAFNEGPRQKAYLMGGTGNVHFPVTTDNATCQKFIDQGVGQIHGFWFLEAERSFRQAASIDPDCAMAYWGCALANERSLERARGFMDEAKKRLEKVTDREKQYIEALSNFFDEKKQKDKKKRASNYLKALEEICLNFPDDIEAKALVAHRVWENSRAGIPIASYLGVNSIINEVLEKEPLHPAHHYTIHLWDYRKPAEALKAAARCGPSAPSIAHMWHMPGHIYSRLKRYEDAVYQQEASARVDHAHMMRDQVMPDQISNFAHNNEWLIRNLIFLGRVDDAVALAKNMTELPRHPKYNSLDKRGSFKYGRQRLFQVIREFQLFDEAIFCCNSVYLEPTDNKDEMIKRLRLLGSAYAAKQMGSDLEKVRSEMSELRTELEAEIEKLKEDIKKTEERLKELKDVPPVPEGEKSEQTKAKEELKKQKADKGNADRYLKNLDKAIKAIDGYEFYAKKEFEEAHKNLKAASGEDVSFLAELQFLSGKKEEGLKALADQVKRRKKETIPMARLIFAEYQNGDKESAKVHFEELREMTNSASLDVELFSRLEPIAEEFGFGKNWVLPVEKLADTGFRPPLDSLGPFRWAPSMAPEWSVPGLNGQTASNKIYSGKPTVVIFYLGHGCLHCAEQLQAFGPQVPKFRENGIDMIAISTDKLEELQLSVDGYGEEMPMELVADPELSIFKKFRAFDDFENQPLHGTFLIDETGKIRWQDISYEPFMDHEFVLQESLRLLGQNPKSGQISKKKP